MKRLALLLILASPTAFALDFTGIQNWTGSGPNRSAFVLDFQDGTAATAWGFYFSGPTNGEQMLRAIDAANNDLAIEFVDYGGTLGSFATRFTYQGRTRDGSFAAGQGFWAYYTADGTVSQPASWTFSDIGPTTRFLADGAWDGWTWAPAPDFAQMPPTATIVPAAPVPEPATLLVLSLGGLALLRRLRA